MLKVNNKRQKNDITSAAASEFCEWAQYQSHPIWAGGTTFSSKFWKVGSENCCHRYLPSGAYYIPCQTRLFKIKYGFEGSV